MSKSNKFPGISNETFSDTETLLYITGGATPYLTALTEMHPATSDCSPPSLPSPRFGHTTFVTAGQQPVIATCGGQVCDEANARRCGGASRRWSYSTSCPVLDPISRRWDERRMGDLTMIRCLSAAVSLRYVGVFVIGGMSST